jgi:glycine hydroxymethyltransferase
VSGLRFGAAALAARGFGGSEFEEVGRLLVDALSPGRAGAGDIPERIKALTDAFPLYPFLA